MDFNTYTEQWYRSQISLVHPHFKMAANKSLRKCEVTDHQPGGIRRVNSGDGARVGQVARK